MGRPRKNSVISPIIYPLDRALDRRWFVQFYIWHETDQVYVERRVSGYINKFKTGSERLAAAQLLKKKIEDKLKLGWTVGKKKAAGTKKLFNKFTVVQALDFVVEKKENETREGSPKIYRAIKKFFPTWLEENGYSGLLIKNITVLGSPKNLTLEAQWKGIEAVRKNARTNEHNVKAGEMARLLKREGSSLRHIADRLNQLGYSTRYGKNFHATTVKRLLSNTFS